MQEFYDLKQVKELFKEKNCIGKENNYFVLMKNTAKYSGMVAGMEYPYYALLINQTEDGIGYFHLVQPKLSLKISLKDLVIDKDSFTFLKNEDIKSIVVKNYALLNKKTKSVVIKTNDKKTHYLYAKLQDDTLPYHNENFGKFVEKYSNK